MFDSNQQPPMIRATDAASERRLPTSGEELGGVASEAGEIELSWLGEGAFGQGFGISDFMNLVSS